MDRTAVTVSTGEANPISPDSTVRQAAVDNLKKVVDVCAALKVDKLCGPFHSALGEFTGAGPTEEEWTNGIEVLRTVADHGKEKGVTLVPLRMHFVSGRAKVVIGIGRGKKSYDKRESIKARDAKRDMDRALKGG